MLVKLTENEKSPHDVLKAGKYLPTYLAKLRIFNHDKLG